MKRLLLWAILLVGVLITAPLLAAAKEEAKTKVVPWDLNHFYVYDSEGIMERITLVNKVAVRFSGEPVEEKRKAFFNEKGAIGVLPDKEDKSLFIMTLPQEVTPDQVVKLLREVSLSGIAEAHPIVIKDNLEAIVEGVEVHPKTHLSAEALVQRLQKYGDFKVRQVKGYQDGFRITLDSVKPPLNIYLLANLVHKDAWVAGASPMFRYLEEPVTASIRVEPVTGTLAEIRRVTLEIRILDVRYALREDLLNKFGEGKEFIPKSADSPPSRMLFYILGDDKNQNPSCQCDRSDVRQGRARVIRFSWRFKHYEVGKEENKPNQGEWVIASPKIVLERGTEAMEVKAQPATFAVMSLIGSIVIPDMPPPLQILVSGNAEKVGVLPETLHEPQYWFDRWLADPPAVMIRNRMSQVSFILLVAALFFFLRPQLKTASQRRRDRLEMYRFLGKLREDARAALDQPPATAYETLFVAMSLFLSRTLGLPSRPDWKDVEDRQAEIPGNIFGNLNFFFTAETERYQPGFTPDAKKIRDMYDALEAVFAGWEPKGQEGVGA